MNTKQKVLGVFFAAIVVISICVTFAMTASAVSKSTTEDVRALSSTIVVGNNIYDLSVQDSSGQTGIGTYTVSTSAGHPQPSQNVLYGGAAQAPWSTYLTVRSYTTGTDYVTTTSSPSSPFTVINLDPFAVGVVPTATSVTTKWSTMFNAPDWLNITQVTAVEGTTVDDSRVRVTANVTNVGEEPVEIGIRYEWDLMIDGNDDSWFAERNPDASWTETEIAYAPPTFEYFETTNDPSAPVFSVFGTVNGPPTFTPPPTSPDRFVYAAWSPSYASAFDYTPTPNTGWDSSVLYYWGHNARDAILLFPGETVSVTAYLYVAPTTPETVAAPSMTPIGLLTLVSVLSVIAAISIRIKKR